jgi:formylglycine-generating enzyme required for sulfatase activity
VSESVIAELRELSKAHAEGRMRRDQYRLRRAQVLDALVGMETPVAQDATRPRQPPAPAQGIATAAAVAPVVVVAAPPAEADAVTESPAVTSSAAARPAPARTRSVWPFIAAGVVIIAGAAAFYAWRSHSVPATDESAQSAAPDLAAPAAEPAPPAPEAVVTGFLQRGDWSDTAVSAMNSAWWSFSDEQVVSLMAQPSMQQLRAGVTAQLQDHLKKVRGGAAPLDPSAPLILLARNLNVQVPEQVVLSFAPPPPPVAVTAPTQTAAAVNPATAAAVPAGGKSSASPAGPGKPPAVAATRPAAASNAAPATPTRVAPAAPVSQAPAPVQPAAPATAPAAASVAAATAAPADPCAEYFTNPRKRFCSDNLQGGETAPPLAIVPAGSFQMGSSSSADEQPVHTVVIAAPVAVTIGEIDLGIYRRFCTQTSRSCDLHGQSNDAMPVAYVSWADANDFAAWLSRVTGQHYRLPSEAEWEYLARAGTKGDFWSDAPFNPGQAIFTSESSKPAGPVAARGGSIETNKWSIRHIAGNLREWTADGWSDNYVGAPGDGSPRAAAGGDRVVRGGSFKDPLTKLRSAARTRLESGSRDVMTGFRLVRELRH